VNYQQQQQQQQQQQKTTKKKTNLPFFFKYQIEHFPTLQHVDERFDQSPFASGKED
jgi:hypothetical protein